MILAGRKADQGKAAVKEVKAEALQKLHQMCLFQGQVSCNFVWFSKKKTKRFWEGSLETDLNPSSETYMKPWWSLDFWELSGGSWWTPRARSLVSPGARGIFQTSTLRWWFSRQHIGTFGGNFGNFAQTGHFFTNHFFTRFLKAFQNCMELWTLRLCFSCISFFLPSFAPGGLAETRSGWSGVTFFFW